MSEHPPVVNPDAAAAAVEAPAAAGQEFNLADYSRQFGPDGQVGQFHRAMGNPAEIDPQGAEDFANFMDARPGTEADAANTDQHYNDSLAEQGADSYDNRSLNRLTQDWADAIARNDQTAQNDISDAVHSRVFDRFAGAEEAATNSTERRDEHIQAVKDNVDRVLSRITSNRDRILAERNGEGGETTTGTGSTPSTELVRVGSPEGGSTESDANDDPYRTDMTDAEYEEWNAREAERRGRNPNETEQQEHAENEAAGTVTGESDETDDDAPAPVEEEGGEEENTGATGAEGENGSGTDEANGGTAEELPFAEEPAQKRGLRERLFGSRKKKLVAIVGGFAIAGAASWLGYDLASAGDHVNAVTSGGGTESVLQQFSDLKRQIAEYITSHRGGSGGSHHSVVAAAAHAPHAGAAGSTEALGAYAPGPSGQGTVSGLAVEALRAQGDKVDASTIHSAATQIANANGYHGDAYANQALDRLATGTEFKIPELTK